MGVCGVEVVCIFGPNVVIFIITSGRKRWYGIRAYVPPNGLWRVHCIRQAFTCGLEGMGNLISGDLNAYLENPRDQQEEQLTTDLAVHVLTYQARHFLPRRKYRAEGNWTWRMWREGGPILGRGYYILGTTKQDFSVVGLREPITPTDHRMFLGVLLG